MLQDLAGSGAACLLFVCLVICAYGLAARLCPASLASTRLTAATVIAYWLLIASFTLLAMAGLFQVVLVLPLAVLCAVLVLWRWGATVRNAARADGAALRSLVGQGFRGPLRWPLLAVAVLLAARALRGLAAPPLGWDGLTYHLVNAARWVASGGFSPEIAPDAWSYYEYFPYGGDVAWAWAMLPSRTDLLLAPAGVVVWSSVLLAGYGLSRRLGVTQPRSVQVALGIALLPAVIHYVTSAYIDNETVALCLASALFLSECWTSRSPAAALLAAASLGALAALRPAYLFVAVIGMLFAGATVVRAALPATRRVIWLFVLAVAVAVALPPYLRAWVEQGNPLYPIELKLGSFVLEGNPQLTALLAGKIVPPTGDSWSALFKALFWIGRPIRGLEHLNLGPLSLPLLLVGLAMAVRFLRRSDTRPIGIFALTLVAVVTASLLSDQVVALRTHWRSSVGRLYAPAVAVLFALAGTVKARWSTALWILLLITQLGLAIPRGWSSEDLHAIAAILWPAGLIAAGLGVASALTGRRGWPRTSWALGAAAVLLFFMLAPAARREHRHAIYRAAAAGRAYDVHHLAPSLVSASPIWAYLDQDKPLNLAIAAGFTEGGHNWLRYPLFGSRLQNDVLYVPPTRDGSIISYRAATELRAKLDVRAWVRRLVSRRVDYVVALAPPPPEAREMERLPSLFQRVAEGYDRRSAAYRFDAQAAVRWLARQSAR